MILTGECHLHFLPQNGFDEIQALIPSIQEAAMNGGGGSKESKANMLNKSKHPSCHCFQTYVMQVWKAYSNIANGVEDQWLFSYDVD